jgi:hypothetical protein
MKLGKFMKSISIGTQVKILNYTFVIKKNNQRKTTLKTYEIMAQF